MSSTPPIGIGEHDPRTGAVRPRHRDLRTSPKRAYLLEALPASLLIAIALILGGSANPLANMLIEFLALVTLAISFIRFGKADWIRVRPGLIVIAITVTIALLELMPLPYGVWRTLPGRQDPARLLDMLSITDNTRRISLDPNATISTLLQTIPGIAVFIATLGAGNKAKLVFKATILSGAILCVALGCLQITGQRQFYFYQETHLGVVTGTFANRDHTADMLLIGLALIVSILKGARASSLASRVILTALAIAMCISVMLTASRFGIFLLLGEIIVIAFYFREAAGRLKRFIIPAVLVVSAVSAWLLMYSPLVNYAINRFNDIPVDLRPQIWRHTVGAIAQYWPIGSGLGTFVPVYQSIESIDGITIPIINHAHNEYLELILELGIVGVVVIVGYLAALGYSLIRYGKRLGREGFASVVGITVLLLHSIVDFPLRNEALMVTFGVLNGIIFAAVRNKVVDTR